jgi:hypothetical protein
MYQFQTQREAEAPAPLEFVAQLAADAPRHLLIVGGLPRSGTSSCDRFLHAHAGCFMTDEHHGLMNEQLLSAQDFLSDYQRNEVGLWQDEAGRSWRGYALPELERSRRRWLLSLLFLYTRRDKFLAKSPGRIAVVGAKLPHVERFVPRLAALFAPCPVSFVYCVREPTRVLSSNWQMPWVSGADSEQFVAGMIQQYAASLSAFRTVREADIPTVVWKTPDTPGDFDANGQSFLDKLGLAEHLGGYRSAAIPVIDEWPPERRRRAAAIADPAMRAFSESPAVRAFRSEFGLTEPAL